MYVLRPFGYCSEMSMPISRIASTAQGCISGVGSMPALYASKRSPARWRRNPSAIWLLAEFWVHRNKTRCFFFSTSCPPSVPSRTLPDPDRLRRPTRLQLIGELVGEFASQDALHRALQVVLYPHELDAADLLVGLDQRVPRPPVAVLGLADRACVEEPYPVDEAVPGLVGVTEGDQIAIPGTRSLRHLGGEGVGPVLGPVEGVEGRGSVNEGQRRTALVAAPGPQIHPEGQRA